MSLLNTFWFVDHPLNKGRKALALRRYVKWQLGSRMVPGPVAVDFVNGSQLLVYPGMTGATGNIYTGLHEFEDMAFLLHSLRPSDLFLDVGANVGSYTILAGAAIGAKCQTFEPIPSTFRHLQKNIRLNGITDRVEAQNIGVGASEGKLMFTSGGDTVNHVVTGKESASENTVEIPVKSLDDVSAGRRPMLIKIDVEGFETNVISGADCLLSSVSPLGVIMELNGHGKRYGFDDEKLHKKMMNYGFESFAYKPFSRELVSLGGRNADSGNTIYLKQPSAFKERVTTAPPFATNGRSV